MDQKLREELLKVLQSIYPAKPEDRFDIGDYGHCFGSAKAALLYIPLFCPEFIEVDGSVLIQRGDVEDRFRDALRENRIPRDELEKSFNYHEIPYLFTDRDYPYEVYEVLARAIAECFRSRLGYLYPQRTFVVTIDPPDAGMEIVVGFFEKR